MTKKIGFRLKELTETGQFEGHAAVFGNVDLQGDRIQPGAFAKTIEASGGRWPVLMGHVLAWPVGFSTGASEDQKGLFVTGEFSMETDQGRNAAASARHAQKVGQPLGLSIGYDIREGGYKVANGVRELTDLEVFEFSIAPVPANMRARLTGVKALETVRQVEGLLREAGFTADDSRTIISLCKSARDADSYASEPEARDALDVPGFVAAANQLRLTMALSNLETIL